LSTAVLRTTSVRRRPRPCRRPGLAQSSAGRLLVPRSGGRPASAVSSTRRANERAVEREGRPVHPCRWGDQREGWLATEEWRQGRTLARDHGRSCGRRARAASRWHAGRAGEGSREAPTNSPEEAGASGRW
jgi:hypothetical protein